MLGKAGVRVRVRMNGPEYPNDGEVLRRAIARDNELEPTVRELERKASEVELRASELERERDEARESASAIGQRYEKLQQTYRLEREAYRKEREEHEGTRSWAISAGPACRRLAAHLGCFVAGCWRRSWHFVMPRLEATGKMQDLEQRGQAS